MIQLKPRDYVFAATESLVKTMGDGKPKEFNAFALETKNAAAVTVDPDTGEVLADTETEGKPSQIRVLFLRDTKGLMYATRSAGLVPQFESFLDSGDENEETLKLSIHQIDLGHGKRTWKFVQA